MSKAKAPRLSWKEIAESIETTSKNQDKEKVSLTLDRPLLEVLRDRKGANLSATINQLLHQAVAQARLRDLLDEMEDERGLPPEETYREILDDWFQRPGKG